MLGVIHRDLISGYDYFGWGDIDVVYGDIRAFYTDKVLTKNVISSDSRICSGHFTLIKNEPWLREAYLELSDWRQRLEDPGPFEWSECLDEARLSGIFSPVAHLRSENSSARGGGDIDPIYWSNNYFVEQWCTPFVPKPWIDGARRHPEVWFWTNGSLTNSQNGLRKFLYLHLMNFKAKRWVSDLYRASTTWDELSTICHFDESQLLARPEKDRCFRIDRRGIHLV